MKLIVSLGIVFWFSFVSCVYGSYANVKGERSTISSISLKFEGREAGDLVQDIANQTNYTIHIEESLKGEVVSGDYVDVSLERFFHRLFKQKNIVVDIDTYTKNVIVHQFGSSVSRSSVNGKPNDTKVALSNVSRDELTEIFAKADEVYQAWLRDPNAVIPFSEVTKKEYDENIQLEMIKSEKEKQDPSRKVALSTVTLREAKESFERDAKVEQLARLDGSEAIALSNMSRREFMAGVVLDEGTDVDHNEMIPFSTMTYAEFQNSKK